jgi:hypothetical protein
MSWCLVYAALERLVLKTSNCIKLQEVQAELAWLFSEHFSAFSETQCIYHMKYLHCASYRNDRLDIPLKDKIVTLIN